VSSRASSGAKPSARTAIRNTPGDTPAVASSGSFAPDADSATSRDSGTAGASVPAVSPGSATGMRPATASAIGLTLGATAAGVASRNASHASAVKSSASAIRIGIVRRAVIGR
jgi:hypothetical protein